MSSVEVGPIEAALNAQRAFMDQYGDPLEQLLSVLVYLIPVQDEDDNAGFWSQAVYSVLDLFGLYRTVLLRSPDALPVVAAPSGPPAGAPSGPSRASARAPRLQLLRTQYTTAAFLLRALRSVQVLLEMRAVRIGSPQSALRLCLRIELIKLVLKLAMCSRTPFPFYVDEEALECAEPPRLRGPPRGPGSAVPILELAPAGSETFVGRRSGKRLPALGGTATQPAAPLAAAPATISPIALAFGDSSAATPRIFAAEALFHGRPLLHLLLLLRRGRRSWAPWLLAVLLDLASLSLLVPDVRHRPNTRAAALESAELQRRRALLWWALARSPLYDRLFQRPCEALDHLLKRIPIVNLFNIVELCLALQPFYFTTSGS
mmetsp:Transcript_77899/g.215294  ORF Transcript_77899/g.215294 Transcript_77899/m.215294 type:complete len:375 (-) Transcript_77899:165-1289(-)